MALSPNSAPILAATDRVASDDIFYFRDDQEPPQYARVRIYTSKDKPVFNAGADGPMSAEEFDLNRQFDQMDDQTKLNPHNDRMLELYEARSVRFYGIDDVLVKGEYPGGKEALAQNLARLVLGVQADQDMAQANLSHVSR